MNKHNFVVGDMCIVLGDTKFYRHHFKKDEIVTIKDIMDKENAALCRGANNSWYVHFDDLQLINGDIINLEDTQ